MKSAQLQTTVSGQKNMIQETRIMWINIPEETICATHECKQFCICIKISCQSILCWKNHGCHEMRYCDLRQLYGKQNTTNNVKSCSCSTYISLKTKIMCVIIVLNSRSEAEHAWRKRMYTSLQLTKRKLNWVSFHHEYVTVQLFVSTMRLTEK